MTPFLCNKELLTVKSHNDNTKNRLAHIDADSYNNVKKNTEKIVTSVQPQPCSRISEKGDNDHEQKIVAEIVSKTDILNEEVNNLAVNCELNIECNDSKEVNNENYVENNDSVLKNDKANISVINESSKIESSKKSHDELNNHSFSNENKNTLEDDRNTILQVTNTKNIRDDSTVSDCYRRDNIYSLSTRKVEKEKDEDVEEFLRASEGLNRCNKRLVKTSLNNSDVLIIGDSPLVEEKVENWEELLDDNKFHDPFQKVCILYYTAYTVR